MGVGHDSLDDMVAKSTATQEREVVTESCRFAQNNQVDSDHQRTRGRGPAFPGDLGASRGGVRERVVDRRLAVCARQWLVPPAEPNTEPGSAQSLSAVTAWSNSARVIGRSSSMA